METLVNPAEVVDLEAFESLDLDPESGFASTEHLISPRTAAELVKEIGATREKYPDYQEHYDLGEEENEEYRATFGCVPRHSAIYVDITEENKAVVNDELPHLMKLVEDIEQLTEMSVATVALTFYKPHTMTPRHRDPARGKPHKILAIGLEGKGTHKKTDVDGQAPDGTDFGVGDAILQTMTEDKQTESLARGREKYFQTDEHVVINDHDAERSAAVFVLVPVAA